MGEPLEWETVEEAVAHLKEHRDDFDSVVFRLVDADWQLGNHTATGAFVELQKCGGGSTLISPDVAEAILNDGILSRLRIPVKLQAVRATPEQ